jgi:predicted kinase
VSDASLLLTCGLPGAGKTGLARSLAADRRALGADEGRVALGPRREPLDESANEKIEQELWRVTQELLRLGVSVVLDFGLWARAERDELRQAARELGVRVELHCLDVPHGELWRRIQARNAEPPWPAGADQSRSPR